MEILQALEQKIAQLVALIKELKAANETLTQSNERLMQEIDVIASERADLQKRIDVLENSMLKGSATVEEEKALTKMVVDDLFKSIDVLIGNEQQS